MGNESLCIPLFLLRRKKKMSEYLIYRAFLLLDICAIL